MKLTELQKAIVNSIHDRKVIDIISFFHLFCEFKTEEVYTLLYDGYEKYLSLNIDGNHSKCEEFVTLLSGLKRNGLIELSSKQIPKLFVVLRSEDGQKPAQIDSDLIDILSDHLQPDNQGFHVTKRIIPLPELSEFIQNDYRKIDEHSYNEKEEHKKSTSTESQIPSRKGDEITPKSISEAIIVALWGTKFRWWSLAIFAVLIGAFAIWVSLPDETKSTLLKREEQLSKTKSIDSDPMNTTRVSTLRNVGILDLRLRVPVPPGLEGLRISPVVLTTTLSIERLKPEATEYWYQFSSSKPLVDISCLSHKYTVNPSTSPESTQPTQNIWNVVVDISEAPMEVPFDIVFRTIYWNICTGEDKSWFGRLPRSEENEFIFKIIFPEGKPYRNFELYTRAVGEGVEKKPYTKERNIITDKSGRQIEWIVKNPAMHYSYQIWWDW
jgi:hypothetical protein